MHVDVSKVKGTSYSRVLLRSSYREGGKIKHRTLGNLSSCSPEEIAAVRLALKHKDKLASLLAHDALPAQPADPSAARPGVSRLDPGAPFVQGPSVGAIAVLQGIASQLGIAAALGDDAAGRLALWQVIARALDQGSRLSAVRLARDLGAACILDLPAFDEDALYANLAWLQDRQEHIEATLFAHRYTSGTGPGLYLYDVTSTYLEGQHNALAAFGYNRDGKRGKKQIVVGLLCDGQGVPVAIEAFKGNTSDTQTVASQIAKLQRRFHAEHITLVGDRGMLRGPQIEQLAAAGMHYITAITKPQIETLLKSGVLQMDLFDQALGEVLAPHPSSTADAQATATILSGERYILRRNPVRQMEMAATRTDKEQALRRSIVEANVYLKEHPRAKVSTAHKRLEKRIRTLGLSNWVSLTSHERELRLSIDVSALAEESKLDGCYVLRTDLSQTQASKEHVHDRYKSLSEVEQAFRRGKTVELELRPVHVRKADSTRGHLLVVMLAYQIMKELGRRWAELDMQVSEGLARLNSYCAVEVAGVVQVLLQPRADVQSLIDAAGVSLPARLPGSHAKVATRKKLQNHRPTRKK